MKGIRLRKNFGKATALTAGFRKARGAVVVTMDADLQDDPADLPSFIAKVEEGLDVVVGWKVNRLDPANRLVLSRIFNGTVRAVTGVKLHDMNCGFKAYRREVLRTIPIYGDLFRYIPALAAWQGFRVTEIPVRHHARKYGASRYGLERILRGFFDLLSVMFLTRYSKKPMHLFGLIGLVFAATGVTINGVFDVPLAARSQDRRPAAAPPRRADDPPRHPVLLDGFHRRVPHLPDAAAPPGRRSARPRGVRVISEPDLDRSWVPASRGISSRQALCSAAPR